MSNLCYVVGKNGYKRKEINGKLDVDHSKRIPVYAVVHQFMNLNDRQRDSIPEEEQVQDQIDELKTGLEVSQKQGEDVKQIRFLPLESNIKKDTVEISSIQNGDSQKNKMLIQKKNSIESLDRVKKMSVDSYTINDKQSVDSYSSKDKQTTGQIYNNPPADQSNFNRKTLPVISLDNSSHQFTNHQNSAHYPSVPPLITYLDFTSLKNAQMTRSYTGSVSDRQYYTKNNNESLNNSYHNSYHNNSQSNNLIHSSSKSGIVQADNTNKNPKELIKDSSITYLQESPITRSQNTNSNNNLETSYITRSQINANNPETSYISRSQHNNSNNPETPYISRSQHKIQNNYFTQQPKTNFYNIKNNSQSIIKSQTCINRTPVSTSKIMDKTQTNSISVYNKQYPSGKQRSQKETQISHIDNYTIKKNINNQNNSNQKNTINNGFYTHKRTNNINNNNNEISSQEQSLRQQLYRQKQMRKQIQAQMVKILRQKQLQQIQNKQKGKMFNYNGTNSQPLKKIKKMKNIYQEITQSDQQFDQKYNKHHININRSTFPLNSYQQQNNDQDQENLNEEQNQQIDGVYDENSKRFKEYYQSQKYFQVNLIEYLNELNQKIDNLEERLKEKQLQDTQARYKLYLQEKMNKQYAQNIKKYEIVQPKQKGLSIKDHLHYIFMIFMLCIIVILALKNNKN